MKKVAFCISGYDIFYGAQQSLYNFLLKLNRSKMDPVFIAPGEGKFTRKIDSINIKKEIINYPKNLDKSGEDLKENNLLNKIKTGFDIIKYIIKYLKYFSSEEIDLVYCNDIRSILTAGLAAKLKRIPVLWYVRIDKDLGIFNLIAANIATKIVTIADNVQNIFNKKLIYNSEKKFKTIYTGLDLSEIDSLNTNNCIRKELNISSDTTLAAVIASIQPRKGQKELIEALIEIKRNNLNDFKLLIVGDILNSKHKDYLKEIKKMIKKNDLENNIIFLGWRDDIFNILKKIDFMILPSFSEGLPRTVLEAFSCSCPVIATDVGGTDEIIKEKENGLTVPPGDIDALVNAIGFLIKNKDKLPEMGNNARKKIESEFKIENYISNLENTILEIS